MVRGQPRGDGPVGSPSPRLGQLLRAGSAITLVALVAGAAISILTIETIRRAADEVAHEISPLRSENSLLLRRLIDAETGLRGYHVTGDPATLDQYVAAEREFDALVGAMLDRTDGHPEWERPVREQAALGDEWFHDFAPDVLDLIEADDSDAAAVALLRGKGIVDEVREVNAALDTELVESTDEWTDHIRNAAMFAIVVVIALLTVIVTVVLWRERRVRRLVSKPLEQIVDTIAVLHSGDLGARTGVTGALEVEAVASAIDDLAERTQTLDAAARRRLLVEQTVRRVAHRVRGALGRADVLERTVSEIGTLAGADRALVMGLDADGHLGEIFAEWCRDGLDRLELAMILPDDPARAAALLPVIQARQSVRVGDVATAAALPGATRERLLELGVGALLVTPVIGEEGPIAVIAVVTLGRGWDWSDEAVAVAEGLADELAIALTHARLYEREAEMVERLRELDTTKSDFVSSVSHELRTPLTSIRGYVEMLRDGDVGPLSSGQHEMLEVVERNADRLLAVIEDLLTLSRIESGSFRVALTEVDLPAIARGLIDEMRLQAWQQHVQLVGDFDESTPLVLGDAAQLERVLMNLLSNAIKFSPDGGRIEVRVWPSTDDPDAVLLEVADEGIGIPAAELEGLFSRFFRASSARERSIHGTGLGLTIVKSIVDHHGGGLTVESEQGVGTIVTVRLQRATRKERVS